MTTTEFSTQFDILYDNIASKSAPGFNNYEKSVMLTMAQEELIKEAYGPYNMVQKAFESSEQRRRQLNNLVKSHSVSTTLSINYGLSPNSKFFSIPNDTFYIIFESIIVSSEDPCVNGTTLEVKPITHDEYNINKKSPFRKPNKKRAWRLDSEGDSVEIISAYTPEVYKMRYIKKPQPIILSNFESDPELMGMGLTINDKNTITECELNSEIHINILKRAVELAIRGYRENTLQANVELNKRTV